MTVQKRYLIVLSIFLTSFLRANEVRSQSSSVDASLTKAFATDELLPVLIEAALKNSPDVKRLTTNIIVAESNLKVSKNAILSGLAANTSYHYGTNYSAVNNESVFNNGFYNLTTAQTGFYNIGIGLSMPITNILNRKHILRANRAQIQMAANDRDNSALLVKQDIIRMYQALKLAHKILALSSSNKQAFQVNYNLAEKEFLQGQLSVSEISRMLDFINKAKMEYETNLNNFQTILLQLETYAGVSLMSLLKQVK